MTVRPVCPWKCSAQVSVNVVNRLLDSSDLFGFLVRNLALEFLFQRHNQLDGIQRICAKVIDE